MKKIVVYGGCFDPVTKGHMAIAKGAMSQGLFDKFWFLPAYKSTWGKKLTSHNHRVRMLQYALLEIPYPDRNKYSISTFEIDNKLVGNSYGIVKKMKEAYRDVEFYFLIGMDNANKMHEWDEHKELMDIVKFVVVPRKGVKADKNVDWYKKNGNMFLDEVFYNEIVSSTAAKKDIAKKGYTNKVAQSVFGCILSEGLYGAPTVRNPMDAERLLRSIEASLAKDDPVTRKLVGRAFNDLNINTSAKYHGNGIWEIVESSMIQKLIKQIKHKFWELGK